MKLSEITNLEIILFQHDTYTIKDGIVLAIVTPILAYLLFDIDFFFLAFFSIIIFWIGFYLLHNMEVVFDLEKKVVWRRFPFLGAFKLIDFDKIYSVELLRPKGFNALFTNKDVVFCMIRTKANPFGFGIPILSNLNKKSKAFEDFQTLTLPKIQDSIETQRYRSMRNNPFLLLKAKENGMYTFSNFSIKPIFSALFFLFIGGVFLWKLIDIGYKEPFDAYSLVFIPLGVYIFVKSTITFTFDTEEGMFAVSYLFGINNKKYSFEAFETFSLIKNTHYFFFSDIEVSMVLINNKTIAIAKFANEKRADVLMQEILFVLNR